MMMTGIVIILGKVPSDLWYCTLQYRFFIRSELEKKYFSTGWGRVLVVLSAVFGSAARFSSKEREFYKDDIPE